MHTRYIASASLVVLAFVGAGCIPTTTTRAVPAAAVPAASAPQAQPQAAVPAADPYAGWNTIQPGNVVSLRIPPDCIGDPGAGNIYVTCGTGRGDPAKTVMHTSSDGMQANIRRGAIADWPEWDKVIASMRVLAPLGRDVQITIEK